MLEKQIESKVCKYARDKGYLVYKFTSPQRRSVPDRIFISPRGVVFFIEFKRKGGKLTKGQEAEIERMAQNNAVVFVVDNVEQGYEAIRVMG
jgi:c-di-GMP-binding flagellar brake protein YcgR